MNLFMWMLAGGFVGWISYAFMAFNLERGRNVSILMGAAGGFFGGKMVAPMFLAAATDPAEFSSSALFVAVIVAAGFLAVGSLVHSRWGV